MLTNKLKDFKMINKQTKVNRVIPFFLNNSLMLIKIGKREASNVCRKNKNKHRKDALGRARVRVRLKRLLGF